MLAEIWNNPYKKGDLIWLWTYKVWWETRWIVVYTVFF